MRFSIPPDHPCLDGHFPGRPLVPGVVLLEHVLQAIEAAHAPAAPLRLPQVKFLRPLLPGQVAEVVLDGAAPRWRFEVRGEDGVLARGEVQEATHG
ncbi:dehydratase [Pseudoxanthomonas suwonensis]|uniref:dehydratase n=1 Tax=Pseudoxanthomonas suwonensis TaxID=314722 RepID=UPI0004655FFD|nr:dehydratase [Pseudoxanthomonas suwonensis]